MGSSFNTQASEFFRPERQHYFAMQLWACWLTMLSRFDLLNNSDQCRKCIVIGKAQIARLF